MFYPRRPRRGAGLSQTPCGTYLAAGGDDQDARDLRRFQLGSRLAGLARQYGNYRPNWLKAWADGEATLDGSPMAGTELWQRDLWARLIKHVHAQSDRGINWILPFDFFRSLEQTGFATRRARFISLVSRMSGTVCAI